VFSRESLGETDDTIVFPYNHNFFQFEFVALNYTHPEKNTYKYKLEGIGNEWIDSGSGRLVRYAGLPPGEYRFRVIGSNNDGLWNYDGASIRFAINPPLWTTWWAYLFYVLFLTAGAYSIHQYRLHVLEARNRILEAKVLERTAEVSK